jgi:DNA invertase Pin-like site-specific DNA recombinase
MVTRHTVRGTRLISQEWRPSWVRPCLDRETGPRPADRSAARRGHSRPAHLVDKKSGSTTNRPGLHEALDQVDPAKLAYAAHLRDQEDLPISEIIKATGITRSSLYRYLPPRPPERLTAEDQPNA